MSDLSENERARIEKAFANKDWPEIASSNSWSIFKIMAEFVDGFESRGSNRPESGWGTRLRAQYGCFCDRFECFLGCAVNGCTR